MGVLRVIEPFSTDVDGVPRVFPAGTLVDAKDPVAKGRDRFFVKVEDYVARAASSAAGATETATSGPGERRSRRSAVKKAITKAAKQTTGADDGQKDPESGSSQVPGVNRKDDQASAKQTPEQRRSEKAAAAKADAANPTGADDGQADPESGPNQIPGPNDDPAAEVPAEGSGSADDGAGGPGDDQS